MYIRSSWLVLKDDGMTIKKPTTITSDVTISANKKLSLSGNGYISTPTIQTDKIQPVGNETGTITVKGTMDGKFKGYFNGEGHLNKNSTIDPNVTVYAKFK